MSPSGSGVPGMLNRLNASMFKRSRSDAYYANLYGLDERDLRYILDSTDVYGADFPGETFRVLKEKEIARYGELRTRRPVLEAWGRLTRS